MTRPQTLHLRVRWTAPPPGPGETFRAFLAEQGLEDATDIATEFGMQRGRTDAVPGVPLPDGSISFETDLEPYHDKAGRQRFRGEFVQGTADEPFLYLSWRVQGSAAWLARCKVSPTPSLGTSLPRYRSQQYSKPRWTASAIGDRGSSRSGAPSSRRQRCRRPWPRG